MGRYGAIRGDGGLRHVGRHRGGEELTLTLTLALTLALALALALTPTCATSAGIVAEKSSVWREAAVGRRARRMASIAGRKPMSSSWSASSKMSTCTALKACSMPCPSSRSTRRPGVATRMAGGRWARAETSAETLVPPTTARELSCGWNEMSCSASVC